MAHTSYEKITSIARVNTDEIGDEVVYDCIHVYFDNREDVSNSDSIFNLHLTQVNTWNELRKIS